ncbi:porin [Xenorhabdus anantnagensis]|uniref:Porin n=1 Tax=Xenorhabdus anantnagensis TaxID=3025875 RepID=A0ABT5LNK8_9GAMM|nr:porin [Xenorhabdus anantnagensis]MDC9595996.1 porin [Xenorhabdus anantnagensis]
MIKIIMNPLFILIGLSVISGSANAVTVYNDKGSKVDVTGQLGINATMVSDNRKTKIKEMNNSIGVNASHKLTKDIRVFGKVGWRANGNKRASSIGVNISHTLTKDIQVFGRMEWGSAGTQRVRGLTTYKRIGYVGASYLGIGEMRIGRTNIPIAWKKKSNYGYYGMGASFFNDMGITTNNGKKVKKGDLLNRLIKPMTIFVRTKPYKGFYLAATYSDKSDPDNKPRYGDIHHAHSVVGFYKSDFGLEASAGYIQAIVEGKKMSIRDADLPYSQDSLIAISAEYYFPGREFSIGLDFEQKRSKNLKLVNQKGNDRGLQKKWGEGEGKENLYGVGVKWYRDKLGSGPYAGYYLSDRNDNGLSYQRQAYMVGLNKKFRSFGSNDLLIFVEVKYNSICSDNPAKNKKETILGMGARLSF